MKLALIGHPISHSKSPQLFKVLRPKWQYDLIETPDFEEAINIFKASYDAISVTAPFKELAFKSADRHEDLCRQVGATNLLVKEKGLIKAYNTDVFGVRECLKECVKKLFQEHLDKCLEESMEGGLEKSIGHNAPTQKALIIGCGGAGKAAVTASLEMGLHTSIINRNEQKCIDLAIKIPEIQIFKMSELSKAIKENDIIIYTLSVNLPELEQIDFSDKIIIEANYKSPVLSQTKSKLYIEGEFWLLKQAEAAADIIS